MLDLAIIIPCYNEEVAIASVLKDAENVIHSDFPDINCMIYVYDNNSTDFTVKNVLDYISSHNSKIIEIRNAYLQGKGNVIRQAFREINARCYCMVDGDNTYDISKLREMYDLIILQKADMVIGDRLSTDYFNENTRPFHNLGNKTVRNLINLLFNVKYKDILSGLRTFSYPFVKTFPVTSDGFTLETELNIHAASHHIAVLDVPVRYQDRQEGSESKLNTIPDGIKVILKILSMVKIYRPKLFYGSISAVLILLSILFFIPVFIAYKNTGLVSRFPTLIVCCFSALAGIISYFAGAIQQTNNIRHEQKFLQMFTYYTTHLNEIIEK